MKRHLRVINEIIIFICDEEQMPVEISELKEVNAMLRTVVEKHKEELLKQGRQEGVTETKIETARIMLSLKYSVNDIVAVTGLSAKEIELLREDEK